MVQVGALIIAIHIIIILFEYCRSGVLSDDELDSDSVDSIDFLMAKLKRIHSERVIITCTALYVQQVCVYI